MTYSVRKNGLTAHSKRPFSHKPPTTHEPVGDGTMRDSEYAKQFFLVTSTAQLNTETLFTPQQAVQIRL